MDERAIPPQIGPVTFLVGSERSGTTLLRLMLDSHPQLAFRYESELFVEAMPDAHTFPRLEDFYAFLRTYRFVDPPPVIDRSLDYPSLVRSMLEQKRVHDRKPYVGATVHKHFDRLLAIWPDARFVHLLRDGRDVSQSCVSMGWYGNVYCATERWATAEKLWDHMVELVPADRRLEVRYEQLVSDPVRELARICAFIGIDYHPAMLEYPKHSSYKAPSPKAAFQWKRKLTPRQVRLIERQLGPLLAARGYELAGPPTAPPTKLEDALLRLHDRLRVARGRLRTFGPSLWAEGVIARRVGTKSWSEAVQIKMNHVLNAHME